MRKSVVAIGAVFALVFVASTKEARADITLANPVVTLNGCGAGCNTFDYLATLSADEALSSTGVSPAGFATTTGGAGVSSSGFKDYVTIYDFAGFLGFFGCPANTTCGSQNVGPTPADTIPTDSASILNVFSFWTGPFTAGPIAEGHIIIGSTLTAANLTAHSYSASATNNGSAAGNTDDKVSSVLAPTAVPEPGSMLLLGTGLVGLARSFRRRRA